MDVKQPMKRGQHAQKYLFRYNIIEIGMQLKTLSPLPSRQTLETTSQIEKTEVFESSRYIMQPDLPRYNSFLKLVLHTMVVALSSFYFGYSMVYLSSIDFLTVVKVYNITMKRNLAQGILMASIPVGGGFGALLSGFFIPRFSRRYSFCYARRNVLMGNALAIIAGLLIFVPTFQILVVGRILQGICVGFSSSLAPLIMKETSPIEISGTLTSFHQIFGAFGVFFALIFSLFMGLVMNDVTGQRIWWIIFGFPLILIVVQSLLLMFVYRYETPKYLFEKDEDLRGRILVEKIYKPRYVQEVIREIKINLGKQVVDNSAEDKSETFTLSINDSSPDQNLRRTPRNAIIVAVHLAALQHFCGINAVTVYGSEIVGRDDPTLKLLVPILINLEQLIAAIFTSYLLTLIGRKALLQVGSAMACVACGIIAAGLFLQTFEPGVSYVLIVFGLVLFMANFGFTLGPVVWVYLSQIVQPNVFPVATTVNWASAALVMLLFPVIRQSLPNKNAGFLFLFFAIWSTLSFFFNKKFIIQTQNKGEKQIFEQFRLGREIKQY